MIIAFDVDGTLEISKGPIPIGRLAKLKKRGFTVGIVGNYKLAQRYIQDLDFYMGDNKTEILKKLGENHPDFRLYVADTPTDEQCANDAGWNFIYAEKFK